MWKEDVRVHPLEVSPPGPASSLASSSDSRAILDRSFLVHSTFSIDIIGIHEENRLIPAAIRALLSSVSRLQRLELTYTRGNRGLFRFPSWFVDRGSGLGLEARFTGSGNDARTDESTRLANIIARMVGCSASSILDRKTFAWYDIQGIQEELMVGYSTQDFPCVESVAQWIKLLPCSGQQGLSGFVKSLRLLEMPYHSLRMVLDPAKALSIEISAIVHKNEPSEFFKAEGQMLRSRRPRHSGQDGQLLAYLQNDDWNAVACPVVKTSDLFVSSENPLEPVTRYVPFGGGQNDDSADDTTDVLPQLLHVEVSNGIQKRRGEPKNVVLGTLVSYIHAEMIGGDIDSGNSIPQHKRVFIRHVIPWEIVTSSRSFTIRDVEKNTIINPSLFFWLPPKPREHAGILEVSFDMPPMRNNSSIVSVELDVERTVLSVFDYPADVSRGVDIPAPLVCVGSQRLTSVRMGDLASHDCNVLVAGQNTLFQLPIPDASMPFNVACFTATLLSLIFGSVLSMILWNKSELASFRSLRGSPKARMKRLVFILIFGGGTLLYVDPSYQAYVEPYIAQVKILLGM